MRELDIVCVGLAKCVGVAVALWDREVVVHKVLDVDALFEEETVKLEVVLSVDDVDPLGVKAALNERPVKEGSSDPLGL